MSPIYSQEVIVLLLPLQGSEAWTTWGLQIVSGGVASGDRLQAPPTVLAMPFFCRGCTAMPGGTHAPTCTPYVSPLVWGLPLLLSCTRKIQLPYPDCFWGCHTSWPLPYSQLWLKKKIVCIFCVPKTMCVFYLGVCGRQKNVVLGGTATWGIPSSLESSDIGF